MDRRAERNARTVPESRSRARTGLPGLLIQIIESSDDAIVSTTLDGVVTSWNAGAEKIYGYSSAEIIGKPITLLIPNDFSDNPLELLQAISQGRRVDHYETERIRKDGALISVSITVSPIRDEGGELVGASSIARDITERKRAEEKARTTSQYARSLIEASLDPLVTISPEGKITDVNPDFSRSG